MKIIFNCYRFKDSQTFEETIFIKYCDTNNIITAEHFGYLYFFSTYANDGWILNKILIFR